MLELLSIVCTAAALTQGSCIPDVNGTADGRVTVRPDAYEARVSPGTYQLSYAGRGHDFDVPALTEHWRRRAAQLCAGDYQGYPTTQVHAPDAGYDVMVSLLPIAASRTYNVEVYGVAHCADAHR